MIKNIAFLIILIALNACSNKTETTNTEETEALEVNSVKEVNPIILECIEAHGGTLYDSAQYQFIFRDAFYLFQNRGDQYAYERKGRIKGESIHDVLKNGNLTRVKDGQQVELSDKEASKYIESINSVIYFATLPHKLADEAVISELKDEISIRGKGYHSLRVTFKQEGGGTDFEDEYYYWINKETKEIDYFAYNYQVNGGGVRFREAYNKRRVGGILFQDYINYKVSKGTPLAALPGLLESNQLEELSRIENENIRLID